MIRRFLLYLLARCCGADFETVQHVVTSTEEHP